MYIYIYICIRTPGSPPDHPQEARGVGPVGLELRRRQTDSDKEADTLVNRKRYCAELFV